MVKNNGFLLDTTILIDLFRGRREAIVFLDKLSQEGTLFVCAIVVSEIFYFMGSALCYGCFSGTQSTSKGKMNSGLGICWLALISSSSLILNSRAIENIVSPSFTS